MERNSKESAIARDRFHEQLREWYASATEGDEIGTGHSYGRTPWVWVKHLGHRYHLNADTEHNGVGDYLALVDGAGESIRWSVVANERGNYNKAAFGPEQHVLSGFYLYRVS